MAAANGGIAAAIGPLDESGPSTGGGRAEHRISEQADDSGVEAGNGGEASQLGIGHALWDEQRRQDEVGDEIFG
jgi:hypothetical protein